MLLWSKRNKTLKGVLLLENNLLWGSNSTFTSCRAASHHPVADYFPITAQQFCKAYKFITVQ